ncbi:MAG: glycosyltransferase family 2 protein [Promicromonosporaceae bacterium]|nr:glycosyltransferase family 2 protein [Promicromonosporaceae bacterium]
MQNDVWVVVPLYNEAEVIGDVVSGLKGEFTHIVCVDDGSTDGSAERARQAGAVVVQHAVNLGQGAALQTGLEYGIRQGAAYLVTFDADGQHQVADAVGMVTLAREQNLGAVFGSRFLDKRTHTGLLKSVVLRTAVWFTRKSTGLKLTDAHNGLRVIRRDAAAKINLRQDRMAHATEIVLQISRSGAKWAEFPVHVLYTDYSKGKGQSLWNSINILIELMVN